MNIRYRNDSLRISLTQLKLKNQNLFKLMDFYFLIKCLVINMVKNVFTKETKLKQKYLNLPQKELSKRQPRQLVIL